MEIFDTIIEWLTSATGATATIAVVVEFVLRLIPSKQPLSIAHLVGDIVKKCGSIFVLLGSLLDKVLPQKVIEETPK